MLTNSCSSSEGNRREALLHRYSRTRLGYVSSILVHISAQGLCRVLSFNYSILWLVTNIGVILHKLYVKRREFRSEPSRWNESCQELFLYLLVLSMLCLIGIIVYMYLGYVKYGSDTRWLVLSALGSVTTISISVFLCWGVIQLVLQSGLIGVEQCFACINESGANETCVATSLCDPNSIKVIHSKSECQPATAAGIVCEFNQLCIHGATRTFWFAVITTGLYIVALIFTAFVIFGRLIPSIVVQSVQRSQLI